MGLAFHRQKVHLSPTLVNSSGMYGNKTRCVVILLHNLLCSSSNLAAQGVPEPEGMST